MIFPYMEYILSICYKSIPVSYGSICVGPARDKEYMEMHGKENKHNQADMRGARCKDVQSPFRWLRHSLHWFHAKTVPDHYLDDSLQASPAETEVLQVFQGKSMMEWTYFSFKNLSWKHQRIFFHQMLILEHGEVQTLSRCLENQHYPHWMRFQEE